eukprot:TRINITY_DN8178_c0_g1_i3.p1 TRINITY_DN8178_c0_g1~~TRINITY_DN8178_c0_g1_i3.p1  ORF type:complete len:100 (+),score=16.22 TRINITY_DN8178_c0_g1_i3:123-422(+)
MRRYEKRAPALLMLRGRMSYVTSIASITSAISLTISLKTVIFMKAEVNRRMRFLKTRSSLILRMGLPMMILSSMLLLTENYFFVHVRKQLRRKKQNSNY